MQKSALILSHERPIYLWATLDSLFRATRSNVAYTLVDQGSRDPLVRQVVDGFVARGLINEVIWMEKNDPANLHRLFAERYGSISEIFFYIESDVVVDAREECWTDRMQTLMVADERLAMLGSRVETADFVSRAELERVLGREASRSELDSIKWFSPERKIPEIADDQVASPFNPPGRLLALRKRALLECSSLRDSGLDKCLRENGWTTGITGAVRHRHLSLFNFFDFPQYDMNQRDQFMGGLGG